MYSTSESDLVDFKWTPQPACARFVHEQIEEAIHSAPWLRRFRDRLLAETGTRLVDWLDHIRIASAEALPGIGYVGEPSSNSYRQPMGIFPAMIVDDQQLQAPLLGFRVESLADVLHAHCDSIVSKSITGGAADAVQLADVELEGGGRVHFVERHGALGFQGGRERPVSLHDLSRCLELVRERSRSYDDPQQGFADALERFGEVRSAVGSARACDLFFRVEREYWQCRNRAAQTQHRRQQVLGLGWANHDHHTYRCSREWFAVLVLALEEMGFRCRERFYAGSEAGWGAQVLEHRECGLVVFADVDMSEEEVTGDFSHEGLPPRDASGTVGLWCKLHGESFLAAGMHHLECQFDFDASRRQLAELGIESMEPFTDFPYLKQAFTEGETWTVPKQRLDGLAASGMLDLPQATRFAAHGAIGSHLEILERNDGYKGFNQTGINKIILATDPTKQSPS